MINYKKEFGFCAVPLDIKAGPVTISPLPDLETSGESVRATDYVENNWIYTPPQPAPDLMGDNARERPYASRVFGLPKTHVIEQSAVTSEGDLDFHVWALSFCERCHTLNIGRQMSLAWRQYGSPPKRTPRTVQILGSTTIAEVGKV